MNAPVLLIFFNRADTLRETFAAIREAKPSRLYLAQDGPRDEKDKAKIEECRGVVSNVDWPCEVFTRFSNDNQGCGKGPYNAINWVFENEDCAIIVEDDCVGSRSFFTFCDEMLEKYKEDERIFLITGCNFELITKDVEESYFFGYSGTNWGWATWKRNWNKMDYACDWTEKSYVMKNLKKELLKRTGLKGLHEIAYAQRTHQRVKNNDKLSYWDVQWQCTRYLYHQLSIIPSRNLITNIGLGPTSTHAQHKGIPSSYNEEAGKVNFCYNKRYELDYPYVHPQFIIPNVRYDEIIDREINPSLWKKVLRKLHLVGE